MHRKLRGIGAWAAPALALSLLAAAPAGRAAEAAAMAGEIEFLKEQIRDLQARVDKLEGKVQQGIPVNVALKVEPVPGGWRKESNWKLLNEGMMNQRVVEILGEPQDRKTVNKFEYWYYGDGMVGLYLRRLKSWKLPSDLDPE